MNNKIKSILQAICCFIIVILAASIAILFDGFGFLFGTFIIVIGAIISGIILDEM